DLPGETMVKTCRLPLAVQKIFAASHCGVAFLGGSLTTGVGASNTAETSWRALFLKYLYRKYHPVYHNQVSEIMGAVGASESFVTAFTLERNVLPHNPDLALVEFCVNDRGVPDKTLVLKGMEGIVRKLLQAKGRCDVMILGTGCRPGTDPTTPDGSVDHSLHRKIADYYDLPFVDIQRYIYQALRHRGQKWDDVSIEFEKKDNVHLNDYGNWLAFEAIRDCFEENVAAFLQGNKKDWREAIPPPLISDELQFTELVDPSRSSEVVVEGNWQRKSPELVPWYFDNLLVGTPGSRMVFRFQGTAVAVFGLMYNNGLKVNAVLDGKKVPGPYLLHFIEFGKGFVLAHGLPYGQHTLELTVAEPSRRHNKLENPTAQIAYLGVGGIRGG
ncbi:MAG: GDSL-type esterase/lipase family protein, partial [Candidatus Omnitrophica bacterium]|nr:GDSL-type esterase/lipase family protein [Candidatus Omnitrophota bacterium]